MEGPFRFLFWTLGLLLFQVCSATAQADESVAVADSRWRVGAAIGMGTQDVWPFDRWTYTYRTRSFKLSVNYILKRGNWDFELLAQPELSVARHKLIDTLAIEEHIFGPDFLELMKEYGTPKTINQYALNLGFLARTHLTDWLSTYFLISVGPCYIDTETDRLPSGFAFSDIVGIGLAFHTGNVILDIRPSIRHYSNAGLASPNGGYNLVALDFGVLVDIGKNKR